MKKIYLAGPDVFLRDGREICRRKRELCEAAGFEGLFPLDQDPEVETDASAIFASNRRLIEQADLGLFNLSPFRGPSADPGTVFELGMLFARGKPLFGYSNATAPYRDRVKDALGSLGRVGARWTDPDGRTVENFDLGDNLMIVHAIAASGGAVVTRKEEAGSGGDPLSAFTAFAACLEIAGRHCR